MKKGNGFQTMICGTPNKDKKGKRFSGLGLQFVKNISNEIDVEQPTEVNYEKEEDLDKLRSPEKKVSKKKTFKKFGMKLAAPPVGKRRGSAQTRASSSESSDEPTAPQEEDLFADFTTAQ